MGVYYFYGNRSKEQWFHVDPAGIDLKASTIGRGLGARALGLLLLDDQPNFSVWENHPLLGSWSGDSRDTRVDPNPNRCPVVLWDHDSSGIVVPLYSSAERMIACAVYLRCGGDIRALSDVDPGGAASSYDRFLDD